MDDMFMLNGTGCNIIPRGPGEPGEPGGRRQTGGPGGTGLLQPRPLHANEKTCNSNVYTSMKYFVNGSEIYLVKGSLNIPARGLFLEY